MMAHDSVAVDRESVRRAWRAEEGLAFWLELRTQDPVGADPQFAQALDEINEAEGPGGVFTQLGSFSMSGLVTLVEGVESADDLDKWLTDLAARLEDAGIAGTICGARPAPYPFMGGQSPEPTAFTLYAITDDVMASDPRSSLAWGVDPTTTARITEFATRWAEPGGPSIYLNRAGFGIRLNEPSQVSTALTETALYAPSGSAWFYDEQATNARTVTLSGAGECIYQIIAGSAPWQERTDLLVEAMTQFAGIVDLAFIRPAYRYLWSWIQVADYQRFDGIKERHLRSNRHLLSGWAPDAHGIQILTDDHLAKAHDLSNWSITELANGRHLVTAKDLQAWYAQPQPAPETVDQARQDFGDMLLTPEVIEANPPPWNQHAANP